MKRSYDFLIGYTFGIVIGIAFAVLVEILFF